MGAVSLSKNEASEQSLRIQNGRTTHHNSRSNHVLALRIDQSRRQKVEIVCNPIRNYGMPCIVPSLGSGAKLHGRAEDIDELSFSLVIEVSTVQLSAKYTARISPCSGLRRQGPREWDVLREESKG